MSATTYTKFRLAGEVYSNDFPKPMTLEQAKQFIREFTGVSRVVLNGKYYTAELFN